MANIKDISKIADKYATVTPGRVTQYKEGVQNPRRPWAEATLAAEGNYKAAVTQAAAEGRQGKGVRKAGDDKWLKGARDKGPTRFSAGVVLGKDNYREGFSPYHQEIQSVTLPPRGPKGDPGNIQRVTAIATALHEKKLSMV